MTGLPESPYKGLSAFEDSELDALLFFGREREREIVVANLIASRLTVLYGPSGVGKSSLLRAAVARSLRELPEEPLVIVFSRWSEDPAAALSEEVAEASGLDSNGGALGALEQSGRDVYLVLDQAEEYFLYHADERAPGTFAELLPAVLTSSLRVNVLFSLREDSLAKLDRFTGRIPGLFANTLRLDRLDREDARAAVVRPLERFAELTGEAVAVEPALVERVLDEVGTGRIEPALGGRGAVESADDGARIEAPYLQLVMQRLWEAERASGSDELRVETLERLGGAQHIVEEHLEGAIDSLTSAEQDVAARLFNHLVTPSGTKIAHELSDLADFGQSSPEELQPVLTTLTERRILRSLQEGGEVRYEIFHDVLAQPVLAWRMQHDADRELALQKDAADQRHRRLLTVIALGSVLLAVVAAVAVFALTQRSEARTQARDARAHELEARATTALEIDPELSLLLASAAARMAPSETAEETLRGALVRSRVKTVVRAGEPLLGAMLRKKDVLAATADGSVVVADGRTGQVDGTTAGGAPALQASFADDGSALFTGGDGMVRVVNPDGTTAEIPGLEDVDGAEISADASLALAIGNDRVRLVDVKTGAVRQIFVHRGAMSAGISRDNTRVVTGASDDTVRVWRAGSGALVRQLPDNKGNPLALAFSPDGVFVAAASADGIARVWRVDHGGVSVTVTGDTTAVTDVGFSTDGVHIVTANSDGTVRVSASDTGAPLVVLDGHGDKVTSAAFSGPVGSSVVSASLDETARVWDALYQPELVRIAQLAAPVTTLEVDPDGRVLATAGARTDVLDIETGKVLGTEPGIERPGTIAGPNGMTATIQGNTVVLEVGGAEQVLEGHRGRVLAVAFSPDGTLLATASRDHTVRIWDTATGESLNLLSPNSAVNDVAFSPDGRWIVTAATRATLWDPKVGEPVIRLQGHIGPVTAARFDPSGRVIVTGGVDGTVRKYVCDVCGGLSELLALADARLAATGRALTDKERARYFR